MSEAELPEQKPAVLTGKDLEKFLINYMARPFRRRLKYLYLGVHQYADTYVFGDTEDGEYEYCEPTQSMGIVHLKSEVHQLTMRAVMDQFDLKPEFLGVVRFDLVLKALAEVKWDLSKIEPWYEDSTRRYYVEPAGVRHYIYTPLQLHFFSIVTAEHVRRYYAVFVEKSVPIYDIPVAAPITDVTSTAISGADLKTHGLYPTTCQDVRLLSIPGHDTIDFKTLAKKEPDHTSGLRLWADGIGCINFGAFFEDTDVIIGAIRINVLIFPLPAPEQPAS